MSLGFYAGLEPIQQFESVTDHSRFTPVPADWAVVLSDIKGSTKAIEAGKYKEVNLIGAAAIAAIQNAIGTRAFPFVFGGDGATALLPSDLLPRITPVLKSLQKHSVNNFGLTLRVGIVPLSEVYRRGGQVLVAKYQIAANNFLAMFQGGGLQVAEHLLKKEPDGARYLLEPSAATGAPALESLSCRWAPIKNRNGTMISVLIHAVDLTKANDVYRRILADLNPIFHAEEYRPVSVREMKLEKFGVNLRRELALRKDLNWFGVLFKVLAPMVAARLALWFPFLPGTGVFRAYLRDSMSNSDYKKLDDTLRMVLDCSLDQASRLEALLRRYFAAGEIIYGTHHSQTALMTCIMEGLNEDEHIHFIDGGDGGYAMAAKGMKAQIKARSE